MGAAQCRRLDLAIRNSLQTRVVQATRSRCLMRIMIAVMKRWKKSEMCSAVCHWRLYNAFRRKRLLPARLAPGDSTARYSDSVGTACPDVYFSPREPLPSIMEDQCDDDQIDTMSVDDQQK